MKRDGRTGAGGYPQDKDVPAWVNIILGVLVVLFGILVLGGFILMKV